MVVEGAQHKEVQTLAHSAIEAPLARAAIFQVELHPFLEVQALVDASALEDFQA